MFDFKEIAMVRLFLLALIIFLLVRPVVNLIVHNGAMVQWFSLLYIFHSTKPELRFCARSIPARGVSEIRDGKNL